MSTTTDPVVAGSLLLRRARPVPVSAGSGGVPPAVPDRPVDLRIADGVVVEVAPDLRRSTGEEELDAGGRFLLPGLWDTHVHLGSWTIASRRLDVSAARTPREAADIVARHLNTLRGQDGMPQVLLGFGHRAATWSEQPTVAVLDAAAPDVPVALISGDGHTGWVNTATLRRFGRPDTTGPLQENDWFTLNEQVVRAAGMEADDDGYREVLRHSAVRGLVGVVELQDDVNVEDWPARVSRGLDGLRIEAGTYPQHLERLSRLHLASGAVLPGSGGLVTVGPVKVISDGALSSRTAHCCAPYTVPEGGTGLQNISSDDLHALAVEVRSLGLELAVHAIGDEALDIALAAFRASGVAGAIEHAQLASRMQLATMAELGVRASVQPAHLLDDRDTADRVWSDRTHRCFPFADMIELGVEVTLGSDAPIAPLDPWLAMAAAVHRSDDARAPWHPEQSLTVAQALAASTHGRGTPVPGSPADLVLVDTDPFASGDTGREAADLLRTQKVSGTLVAGRWTHRAL